MELESGVAHDSRAFIQLSQTGLPRSADDGFCVRNDVDVAIYKHSELSDKVTIALPPIVGQSELRELGVGAEFPDWKSNEKIAIQMKLLESLEVLKRVGVDRDELIVLKIELSETGQRREFKWQKISL